MNGPDAILRSLNATDNTASGIAIYGKNAIIYNCTSMRNTDGVYGTASFRMILSRTSANRNCGVNARGTATIEQCTVYGNRYGIYAGGANSVIYSSSISSNRGYGVYAAGSSATIYRNTVQSNGGDGITARGSYAKIYYNTANRNRGSGISSSSYRAVIAYNRASYNSYYGIYSSGKKTTLAKNSATGNRKRNIRRG